jgi:hypothetical protein
MEVSRRTMAPWSMSSGAVVSIFFLRCKTSAKNTWRKRASDEQREEIPEAESARDETDVGTHMKFRNSYVPE